MWYEFQSTDGKPFYCSPHDNTTSAPKVYTLFGTHSHSQLRPTWAIVHFPWFGLQNTLCTENQSRREYLMIAIFNGYLDQHPKDQLPQSSASKEALIDRLQIRACNEPSLKVPIEYPYQKHSAYFMNH